MPETAVEVLVRRGPGAVTDTVAQLEEFFRAPERRAAVRLGILGLTNERDDDERRWGDTQEEVEALFGEAWKHPTTRREFSCGDHTIRRFANGLHDNRDRRLEAYLALYLLHQIEKVPNLKKRLLVREALSIGNSLKRASEFVRHGDPAILAPHSGGYDLAELLTVVHRALATDDQSIRNKLFADGTPRSEQNISYYSVYRYSTKRDEVVKSFLAILGPEANNLGSYSFSHVYGPGAKTAKRISRGAVLGFQSAICFMAGAGLAPDRDSAEAPLNQGMKAFAIPHAAFVPDHRLLTGVMLSSALSWHPIIGRIAMVHLGFRSSIGELTDESIGIRFMPATKLDDDIRKLCTRCNLGEDFSQKAAEYVRSRINNGYHVDISAGKMKAGVLRSLTIEEMREPPD